jgi:hypothetical protein
MITIYVNREIDEPSRRESIYSGDFHVITGNSAARALVDWAHDLIGDAFGNMDPERAQFELPQPDFVSRVSSLKSTFTNHQRTKELVRELVIAMGADPQETYFDLPRLRVIPSEEYLTTGVSYNYKAHRDTWYAGPKAQVNYWTPVFDTVSENVMSMYVGYFDRPIKNSSSDFDYDRWVSESRFAAAEQIGKEERPHPLPTEPVDDTSEIRVAGRAGDMLLFSTCHLHASAPNTSGVTRFSYDLRTIHMADHREGRGPANIDSGATGTTLLDFIRVSDLAPVELATAKLGA